MRISDWSSDVCSSDLIAGLARLGAFNTHQQIALRSLDAHVGRQVLGGCSKGRVGYRFGQALGIDATDSHRGAKAFRRFRGAGLLELSQRPVAGLLGAIGRASWRERVCS